ncbi:MAG: hypothetical protein WC666_02000 [Candidatus Paceibacterota bacterium]|jgi:hypothetical protein
MNCYTIEFGHPRCVLPLYFVIANNEAEAIEDAGKIEKNPDKFLKKTQTLTPEKFLKDLTWGCEVRGDAAGSVAIREKVVAALAGNTVACIDSQYVGCGM